MITFIVIVLVVLSIVQANSPDKKSKKQLAINEKRIAVLPDMAFYSKEMSSMMKALNLWPNDKVLLQEFKYTSINKMIYLKMKDGKFVNCFLSDLVAYFDKGKGEFYQITVKNNNTKFSFYTFPTHFTDKEWYIILNTLTLAGTTYNVDILGSTYKNLSKVNTVLRIIKALQ